jgi:glycolate oxidase FAD binding subunit
VQELICRRDTTDRLLPVAGASKPGLSLAREGVTAVDVSDLRGVVQYDPAELTITARAATPIAEVAEALAEHGQYLPFDPPLANAGATLGGAVSAATSGPNAFRHGGVRDFVIGVRLIDGMGRLVSGGGKVVKNAAGFDLPKLMVGSRGGLGVMTELSFKVFPCPRATVTHRYEIGGLDVVLATIARLCRGPLALDAVDVEPGGRLVVRLGGDPEILGARSLRLQEQVGILSAEILEAGSDKGYWESVAEFAWAAAERTIVRVAIAPAVAPRLGRMLGAADALVRYSLAANLAWIAWPETHPIDELATGLTDLGLAGVALTGSLPAGLVGVPGGGPFAERVRSAFDPFDRFVKD